MAATSAGHQTQQQQQQQPTNVAQQKLNTPGATLNVTMARNTQLQQQQQIHNLQQQQNLMQQYTMKQQQQQQQLANNYNMQQQQPAPNQSFIMQQQQQTYHVTQQQMHLKMQQQQQQMFHNQNSQFASNMMPCQNFMTPPPQLHTQPNKLVNSTSNTNNVSVNDSNNTSSWTQPYQNFQPGRKPAPTLNNINNNTKQTSQGTPRPKQTYPLAAQINLQTCSNNSNNNNNNNNATNEMLPEFAQQHGAIVQQKALPLPLPQQQRQNVRQEVQMDLSDDKSRPSEVATEPQHVASNNNIISNNNNVVKDLQTNVPKKLTTNGLIVNQEAADREAVKANLPPGWRRHTNDNNEIVYIRMQCGRTKRHFSNILDNMVYRNYTSVQTEEDVRQMWHIIKSTFQRVLDSRRLLWMKAATRQHALEKLKTMKMEINSYQHINFDQEFEPLTMNKHDYVENIKSILMWNALKSRDKLHEAPRPYDDADMSFTPAYILNENLIKVPVSMLQPYYLWSGSYPSSLKFATLGFLISHELIHGFDREGRVFDTSGNQREWWDENSNQFFMEQTECFSRQYHQYIYNGRALSVSMSQSENIADNGGIRLAYEAYLQWYVKSMGWPRAITDLETMPRLNYTSKQLFFIGYGQLWCSSTHPIIRNYVASTDEHVPDKFRVIGPLSNLEEFAAEFKCPVGSRMNPRSKCVIY